MASMGIAINEWTDKINRQTVFMGLAILLVIVAVIILVRNWGKLFGRPQINTVAFFQLSNTVGVDFSRPITANNPPDPASPKDTSTYEFAGVSGKFLIVTYPNNPAIHPILKFQPVRQPVRPPVWVKKLDKISDPARRALTMAVMRGPWAMRMWLRRINATHAQQQTAHTAAQTYQAAMVILQQEQEAGTFAAGHLQAVLHVLHKFTQAKGDVYTDSHRQHLAQAVFAAGNSYLRRLRAAQQRSRTQYVDTVYNSLTDKQITALGKAVTKFLARFGG